MSADVHANRLSRLKSLSKLAGPATRNYDGGHKMSSQKRKRDKAQEQLRTRMRQRINGNGNSSTLIHNRRSSSILEGSGDTSLSPRMRHTSSMEVTPRDLQGNNFWRTQQDRYNALTGMQSLESVKPVPPKISANQTVPLQELVDRVLHRKEPNFGLGSKVSPMTIRAYKPPVAPYAMQQGSHVKKIVKMKPIQRSDREEKGPFVLVLQRNGSDETQSQHRGRRRDRLKVATDTGNSETGLKLNTVSTNQILPPVNESRSPSDLKTWRPALDTVHQPSVLPEAEDRTVTNYRLQMQQANKLAESRFEFQHQVPSNQTVEEMTMQTLNPLPPIQSVYSSDGAEESTGDSSEAAVSAEQQGTPKKEHVANRTSSKSEILSMRKAQKEAKRQKQVESEEYTLLRTRKRFTNKTKQFKSELERARQLSAIAEDRSSLSLRGSSASRKASFSSTPSASSLNRIHEGGESNSTIIHEDESESDSDESEGVKSHHAVPLAPPTSPSVDPDTRWDRSGVIMNVEVMKSNLDDSSSSSGSSDSSRIDNSKQFNEQYKDSITGDEVNDDPLQESQDLEEMVWVEGDTPFEESSSQQQELKSGHTR